MTWRMTRPYRKAVAVMHTDMAVDYSGDADVDVMRGMIPHHQGAIDMARIVPDNGANPEFKAVAQDVIAAQEAEIMMMEAY